MGSPVFAIIVIAAAVIYLIVLGIQISKKKGNRSSRGSESLNYEDYTYYEEYTSHTNTFSYTTGSNYDEPRQSFGRQPYTRNKRDQRQDEIQHDSVEQKEYQEFLKWKNRQSVEKKQKLTFNQSIASSSDASSDQTDPNNV